MNKIKVRWRLYLNFVLLSLVLITTFQNCSGSETISLVKSTPLGLEVVTE